MKKQFWAIFLLVFICSGCDRIYRFLHKEGAEEKDLVGEADPLEANPKIEEIQRLLKLHGYTIGRIDGRIGYRTRLAIESFQQSHHLKITRFVDKETWQELNSFGTTGLIVNGQVNFKVVQAALKLSGFDPGSIDGKAGYQTDRALRDFQKAKGLIPDGKVGPKTFDKLNEVLIAYQKVQAAKKNLKK